MGAANFRVTVTGRDASDAFRSAVETARYQYGNGGYTGTIAEKHSFVMVTVPKGARIETLIRKITDDDDKWGPAHCIALGRKRTIVGHKNVKNEKCERCGGSGRLGSIYARRFCDGCGGAGRIVEIADIVKLLPTFVFFGLASE